MSDTFDDPTQTASSEPRRGWGLLWTGIGLIVLGPIAGVLGTIFGMMASFRKIEESPAPTPTQLAEGVEFSRTMTLIGLMGALIGLGLVIVALIRLSRSPSAAREPA